MLFNEDMDRRLSDLHGALSSGAAISASFHPAYKHASTAQPDRIVVDIVGTPRRLVFPAEMATGVAAQLLTNGLVDAALSIKGALPLGPKYGGPGWGEPDQPPMLGSSVADIPPIAS